MKNEREKIGIGFLLAFIFALFGVAVTRAPGQPAAFRNGAELEKLISAGKRDLYFSGKRGAEIFIDREIVWRGVGTVDMRGAMPKVRVPRHAAAFRVMSGGRLLIKDYQGFTHNGNWFAKTDGGEFLARKFSHRGTNGVFGRSGIVNMIGGESITRAYGLYAGDVSTGGVCKVYAEGVVFKSAEPTGEACYRSMASYGDFVRCKFDSLALTKTKKESNQSRYGVDEKKTVFTDCEFNASLNIFPLYEKGSDLGAEYRGYSLKNLLDLEFIRCKIRGYTMTGGNTRVKFIECDFVGKDPRGIGGDTAITTGWAWGVRSSVEAVRCKFSSAWKRPGDSGVTIK